MSTRGSFSKRIRLCDVMVTDSQLKCDLKGFFGSTSELSIDLDDILAIQTLSYDASNDNSQIAIHYAQPKKGKKKALIWKRLVVDGDSATWDELNAVFSDRLTERLRVKKYLIILNPVSGKKKAMNLVENKVGPLFQACGAKIRLYETKHQGDVKNAFCDEDLTKLDGVIVVGGDGFYSEVMTAIILRQQQKAGVDSSVPDSKVEPIPCPVGIIPAGSGNYISLCQHGFVNAMHSAIKIVKGETTPTNLVSIHQGGRLEKISGLLVGFGLLGDMMDLCEKNRWMGNARCKILPIKSLLNRRLISSEVEYLSADTNKWNSFMGDVYAVDARVVNLLDDGRRLVPTFGQDALSLIITKSCPLGHHIKQLSKIAEWKAGAYQFDFIMSEQVKTFRVSLLDTNKTRTSSESGDTKKLENEFYMNVDGDVLLVEKPTFQVTLHSGVVALYG